MKQSFAGSIDTAAKAEYIDATILSDKRHLPEKIVFRGVSQYEEILQRLELNEFRIL